MAVDKDYHSILKKGDPHPFLLREWAEKKSGQLFTYQTLTPFFNYFFPDIHVSSVIERHFAIKMLNSSNTFAETHEAIAQLAPYINTLTDREKDELFNIAEGNNQVSWIRTDSDIQEFYRNILKDCSDRYPPDRISTLEQFFGL